MEQNQLIHKAMLVSRRYALCNRSAEMATTGIIDLLRFADSSGLLTEQDSATLNAAQAVAEKLGKESNEWYAGKHMEELLDEQSETPAL